MTRSASAPDFQGLRVASFESRRALEMAALITRFGGDPLIAPAMQEIPLEKNTEALRFGEALEKGKVDALVCTTNVGVRFLLTMLESARSRETLRKYFSQVFMLARGPKTEAELLAWGLKPNVTVAEPGTSGELVEAFRRQFPLSGKRVAVQEYGTRNQVLLDTLSKEGAALMRVPVYRWALPEDTKPIRFAIEAIRQGRVDVLIFTNAHQIAHVLQVAREHGLEQSFREALGRVVVASVGPHTSACLDEYGLTVDVEPVRTQIEPLVQETSRMSRQLLEIKRKEAPAAPAVEISTGKSSAKTVAVTAETTKDIQESLLLKACRREPVARTPIWLMRQAGRYLQNYRDVRAQVSFLELCKQPDLAAQVTVDTVCLLDVDAAIIFSDILLVLEPMGLLLEYTEHTGPVIHNPLRSAGDVDRLLRPDVHVSLDFVMEAIKKTCALLPAGVPLIGFSGAPFTLASYMIEGKSSRNFVATKSFMHGDPGTWRALLDHITDTLEIFLKAQVRAGAAVIQIFDSWVGCLSPTDYEQYVLPHTRRLVRSISNEVPVILFGTQTSDLLELMKAAGSQVLGLDWRVSLKEARRRLGNAVAIQGNLDPTVLFSDRATIKKEAERILAESSGAPGHIFNLGHGVLPETPVDHVHFLVDIVKNWKG